MGFPQNYKCFNKYLIFAVIYNLTGKKKTHKKTLCSLWSFLCLEVFFSYSVLTRDFFHFMHNNVEFTLVNKY